MTEWKKRIMRAQSLDDLCAILNEAVTACESGPSTADFQSITGLSGKDWTNLPVFGPDEWGVPQGVYSWDVRGNVLVHDDNQWLIVPFQEVQPVFYSGFDVAVEWDEDQSAWLVHGPNRDVVGQHDTPWEALRAFERGLPRD
ncbi:MAG: hypothetical protein V1792_11010 [Pseudomonadota bacterium]